MTGGSTLNDCNELYQLEGWGDGYFGVNDKGHMTVCPDRTGPTCDLYELVQSLIQRGMEAPILLRFDGIIRNRIDTLQSAFNAAIKEFDYKSSYRLAFPIKVNQQRHIVDVIRLAGKPNLLSLEVGSKPELVAVLSIHDTAGALLLCNGYKDDEYIELALLGSKIGRRPIIIIEQLYELANVLKISAKLGIDAEIGFRMKPSSKGSGRWESSGGDMAKFGLSTHEIVLAVEQLQAAEKTHWLKLLHFHIGSQITNIISVQKALREATRMYTELAKLCPSLCFFDAGGGLAIDYTGCRTSMDSSMNYSLEEYARDVVYAVGTACDEAQITHPVLITESGRAIVAHHSILITEVIDVAPALDAIPELPAPPSDHEVLAELCALYEGLSLKNYHEALHDAMELKDVILQRFIQGDLDLAERAYADRVYRHLIAKIRHISKELDFVPDDVEKLDRILLDTYFCNFSVFQSLPDSWAINQLFPVMPIHRLDEEPTRRGIIADLSCDSDGKIDQFVARKQASKFLPLHAANAKPYFLGIFLVGAYQEILGGLHNLFGDTNAVHVDVDEGGNWVINHVIEGDTIEEVLHYVQYESPDLIERLRLVIEKSLKAGHLTNEESAKLQKRFKAALDSYTYLVV